MKILEIIYFIKDKYLFQKNKCFKKEKYKNIKKELIIILSFIINYNILSILKIWIIKKELKKIELLNNIK